MRIRAFREDDTDHVVQLWRDAGLVRPWNDPHRDIARKLTTQRELFLVGVVEERTQQPDGHRSARVVGTAMAGYDGHRGWVNYLAVAPDRHRRGWGRQLMAHVEQLLLDRGCPKLNLQVRSDNADALGFYRSLGYEVDATVSLGKRLITD